jgi:nucleolar MIF4G domain-containing protein 1
MIEAIGDLKNNRRKLVSDNSALYEPLMKVIRHMCDKRSQMVADPLRVPLKDLLSADEKGCIHDICNTWPNTLGRWWLVGSAWAGNQSEGVRAPMGDRKRSADDDLEPEQA